MRQREHCRSPAGGRRLGRTSTSRPRRNSLRLRLSTFITDPVSRAENSFYTGGGSKDERDIPAWQYGTSNDVVPDKDDIADAFAAAYTNSADDPDTIIYFGVDRYDNNGDAETGFWFFKEPGRLNANGTFNGSHTVGDVLVLANWGGSNPVGELTVYQWVGGKNPLALVVRQHRRRLRQGRRQ